MEKYLDFLKNVYFFKDLEDDNLQNILKYCCEEDYKAGEILFYENDKADKFFIVLKGAVEVWKAYDTDDADMLAIHKKGQLFGEMALVDDMPRSATILSRGNTKVLYIRDEDFLLILNNNPSVTFSILRSLSSMVRKSNNTFLEDLKERNVKLEKAYTDLKKTQEELLLKERFSNLGKFSSMILHDIRNPISIVRSYGEMILQDKTLDGKLQKYIGNMVFETERLNNLANELLDYSRGEIRLNMSIVNISTFLDKVGEYIKKRFSSRRISISIDTDYYESAIFDQERMFRVFTNIADNARKAMSADGVFSINAKKRDENLAFSFKDNGEGMTPSILSKIFEPFYSASKGEGTGLGMVIVKNIVEAHDGTLTVESTPGEGTLFVIELPLRG